MPKGRSGILLLPAVLRRRRTLSPTPPRPPARMIIARSCATTTRTVSLRRPPMIPGTTGAATFTDPSRSFRTSRVRPCPGMTTPCSPFRQSRRYRLGTWRRTSTPAPIRESMRAPSLERPSRRRRSPHRTSFTAFVPDKRRRVRPYPRLILSGAERLTREGDRLHARVVAGADYDSVVDAAAGRRSHALGAAVVGERTTAGVCHRSCWTANPGLLVSCVWARTLRLGKAGRADPACTCATSAVPACTLLYRAAGGSRSSDLFQS